MTTKVDAPEHFAGCDEQAIGKRVRWLAAHNGQAARFTLDDIMSGADEHRGYCTCFKIQLENVEADLRVRRESARRGLNRDAEIAALIARRDALREVQS